MLWPIILLFPNPTKGVFSIKWNTNELVTIKVFDVLGKLVFYEKNRNLSLNPRIQFDSSKGLYFVKVDTKTKEVTKKLIIEIKFKYKI